MFLGNLHGDNKVSFSQSFIDIVNKTGNLKSVLAMECHGNDAPPTFLDTPLFSLLILLVHVSKFNVHDTPIILLLKLA